jgi:hypothetical protein
MGEERAQQRRSEALGRDRLGQPEPPVYGSGWLSEQPLVRGLEARSKNDKW